MSANILIYGDTDKYIYEKWDNSFRHYPTLQLKKDSNV